MGENILSRNVELKMGIQYILGDATLPRGSDSCIIAHIVNDVGAWGRGFVVALSKRYPMARTAFLRKGKSRVMGDVQFVQTGTRVLVANMFAQSGVGTGVRRVRYGALKRCLKIVGIQALQDRRSVHMPRIGCGLGGGSWEEVEPLIQEQLSDRGVFVTIYAKEEK
jgi:O-acetyl-ADP-ribose deacetylase (regulator of RNase III)